MQYIEKPKPGEYPPYADMYISLLPDDGFVLKHLEDNLIVLADLVRELPEKKLLYRYAEGKWTIKEILVHLIDDERIYVYRALRFARNDGTELPGFDQDHYALHSAANERSISDILDEYRSVRQATVRFFASLDRSVFMKSGIADGNRATVRALAYHIAGHEMHHMRILKERYL